MSNEIHFDFSSLQNIIVILLIIGIGIYVYFELNKIKKNITEIEFELYNIKRANNLINEEYQNNDTQENINDTMNETQGSSQENINDTENPNMSYNNPWNDIHTLMQNNSEYPSEKCNDENLSDGNLSDGNSSDRRSLDGNSSNRNLSDGNLSDGNSNDGNLSDEEPNINIDDDISKILSDVTNIASEVNKEIKSIKPDYKTMTVSQLKGILSELSLPISGNKTKLIQRIKENNTLQL